MDRFPERYCDRTARAWTAVLCLFALGLRSVPVQGTSLVADCNANGVDDLEETRSPEFDAGIQLSLKTTNRARVADLDGDGDLDIAAGFSSVLFVRNDGSGRLTSTYPSGDHWSPRSVQFVDIDGDADLDAVSFSTSGLRVALNDGASDFSSFNIPISPLILLESFVLGDPDDDGDLDIVTVTKSGDAYFIDLAGTTFLPPAPIPALNRIEAFHDLDGDGDDDAVFEGGTEVRIQSAPKQFGSASPGLEPSETKLQETLWIGDLSGDGVADLAAAVDLPDGSNVVRYALGSGGGTFFRTTEVPLPDDFPDHDLGLGLTANDLDGDGDVDLAVANAGAPETVVLRNRGTGSFAPFEELRTGRYEGVQLGDVTGDGIIDMVLSGKTLTLLRGKGDGSFAIASDLHSDIERDGISRFYDVTAADLDGDADLDLVGIGSSGVNAAILMRRNLGERTFGAVRAQPLGQGVWLSSVASADVDADGKAEIAVALPGLDAVWLMRLDESGELVRYREFAMNAPLGLVFAKADDDGDLDLVVANSGTLSVLRNDGSDHWADAAIIVSGLRNPLRLEAVDLDADGVDEIAFNDDLGRRVGIAQLTTKTLEVRTPTQGRATDLVAADVDSDGDVDLIECFHSAQPTGGSDRLWIRSNDGGGVLTTGPGVTLESGGYPDASDFNADGIMDLAAGSSILFNAGTATRWQQLHLAPTTDPLRNIAADLDADGRGDIVQVETYNYLSKGREFDGIVVFWNDSEPNAVPDCNRNRVPDSCELSVADCNQNLLPDDCEIDADNDSVIDPCDLCPGTNDLYDGDNDGILGCLDLCPTDPNRGDPVPCGCHAPDRDGDGRFDCEDNCRSSPNPEQSDRDGDGHGDACDMCIRDVHKQKPGVCGCGLFDRTTDTDGDGVYDCRDRCPGEGDNLDRDLNGVEDCLQGCSELPGLGEPGSQVPMFRTSDVNCDARATVSDLVALGISLVTGNRAPCFTDDANGDCSVNHDDLDAVLDCLFGLRCACSAQ